MREVIDCCRRVTGREITVQEKPRRSGDPARLIAGSARARAELGWKPQFEKIDPIVESAWAWHAAHPNGYGD